MVSSFFEDHSILFINFIHLFEFAPGYFSDKEIIKPYFTFMFLYAPN